MKPKYKVGDILERTGLRSPDLGKVVFNPTGFPFYAHKVLKVFSEVNGEYEYLVLNYHTMGEMTLKESDLVIWQGTDEELQTQELEKKAMESVWKFLEDLNGEAEETQKKVLRSLANFADSKEENNNN